MSNIGNKGDMSTSTEVALLTALNQLAVGGPGTAIQKTGPNSFENVSIAGGFTIETPTGTVDGSNVTFTVTNTPQFIISDGATYFDGYGYTIAGLTLTLAVPPTGLIRNFY